MKKTLIILCVLCAIGVLASGVAVSPGGEESVIASLSPAAAEADECMCPDWDPECSRCGGTTPTPTSCSPIYYWDCAYPHEQRGPVWIDCGDSDHIMEWDDGVCKVITYDCICPHQM